MIASQVWRSRPVELLSRRLISGKMGRGVGWSGSFDPVLATAMRAAAGIVAGRRLVRIALEWITHPHQHGESLFVGIRWCCRGGEHNRAGSRLCEWRHFGKGG